MSSFKKLSKSDVTVVPYYANKQWDITCAGSGSSGYLEAWSSQNSLITARNLLAGAGTQNAGLAFGGAPTLSCTEEYDGSSWTAGGNLSISRNGLGGAGTQNEALAFGGATPVSVGSTEEYNGSSWSTGGSLINSRYFISGTGTQNAGLAFGGYSSPTTVACTEEYDGSIWSAGGALITARLHLARAGTQNAALGAGGSTLTGPQVSCTEEYNGTSWTAGGALITARRYLAGTGTQNEALAFGGCLTSTIPSCTEKYDGSVWTAGSAMIDARKFLAGAGTQSAGLAFGGATPVSVGCTEEYNITLIPPSKVCVGLYKGTKITGSFNTSTDPITSGQYDRLIYDQINQLFYQSYTSPLNTSSLVNSIYYESASQQRPTASYFIYNDNSNLIKNFPTGLNNEIRVLTVDQNIYGNKILPNSFVLSSSVYYVIDDGYGNLYDTKATKTHIGNIFYSHGLGIITNQSYQKMFTSSFTASFKNEHTVYENEVRCLVKDSDYNLSYNPSLVTGSYTGSVLRDFATGSEFYTYATTLGLYNDNNELLAVAKFGKPMLMSPDTDMTFVVKYDT